MGYLFFFRVLILLDGNLDIEIPGWMPEGAC